MTTIAPTTEEDGAPGARLVIGFATTCMNRRWQLEQTLADNLGVLAGSPHFIALCDYNSGDDVGSLVKPMARELRAGRLIYFRTAEPRSFHASKAKNTAHRLALRRNPDVLFNLDGDNRITRETLHYLERAFRRDRDCCFHNWAGEWGTGTSGRVALSAERWKELGGYDEELLPVGWQDLDLLYRARAIGLPYELCHWGTDRSVTNTFRDKIANADLPADLVGAGASDTYTNTSSRNIITALGRPIRQELARQQRYRGLLNFTEPVEV